MNSKASGPKLLALGVIIIFTVAIVSFSSAFIFSGSIVFLGGDGEPPINNLALSYTPESWQLVKATGTGSNFTLWTANAKDKKTEIGFLCRDGYTCSTEDRYLTDGDGTRILDNKNKEIKLKWESSKCDGQNCYHITLTEAQAINIDGTIQLGENSAQAINIDGTIQLGENSAQAVYIEGQLVQLDTSWGGQVNQTFECEGIDPKDVIVSWNGNKGKSEAEFNFDGLRGCSITMNSTDVMNQHDDWVSLDDPNNRGVHKIRFKKVCDRTFEPKNVSFIDSRTGLEMWKLVNQTNANCVFDYSEDKKNLIVSFTSDKYVDPEFVVADCDSGDLTTTCYLNHTWVGDNGDVINANNLVIQSNGSIASDQAIGITINLTGDFTIESGGNVSLSGANAATAPKAGGDLIVVADLVNITSGGGIYSNGGRCTSTCNAGASAGEINISSDSLDIEGDLELNGGAGVGCCGRDGGLGGTLILNVVNDFDFKGTVEGFSGTASDTKASGILIVDDDSLNMNVSGTIDLSPGWAAAGNNDPGTWGVSSVLLNKLNVLSSGSMQVAGLVNATNLDVHGKFGAEGHDGNQENTVTVKGGDLEIIADVLNLTGTIVACAGDSTANSRIGVNGHGGNLDITATTAYMTGDITTRGGNAVGCCGRDGGDGGDIDISVTNDYTIVGDVISDGGNGDDSGDGGDIFINNKDTNLTIEGSVTASVGTGWGVTFGGKINISADNLSVTGTLTTTANTVGEIALIYDSGLDLSAATVDQDPFITRNTTNAKVRFFSAIANPTTIDYLDGIVIDTENISVDSVAYSDLNVSAELWFYDIVAATPSPLRNGEACPEAICTEIELDGTTYKYNVTYFTNYSVGGAVNNPPVSTLTFPDNASTITVQHSFFNSTCTDDSDLANVTYYVWNSTDEINVTTIDITGTTNSTGLNISLPRDDDYIWNAKCCDDESLCDWDVNRTVTVSSADTTLPTITITEPINNTNSTDTALDVKYVTSDDTAVDSCKWSDDLGVSNTTLPTCANLTGPWSEATHNIWIWVNDTAGNEARDDVSFTLDTIAPYFTSIVNQTIGESTSLSYTPTAADDGVGIIFWTINETSLLDMNYNTGEITNNSELTEGLYIYNISINDSLNNKNWTIWELNVTSIDSTAPTITLVTPNDGSQDTDGIVRFVFNVTDSNDISNCSLAYQSGIYTTSTNVVKNSNNVIEITGIDPNHVLSMDSLLWSINCTDEYSNVGESETRTLDTREEIVDGGGGGGGTVTRRSPRSIALSYPVEWKQGKRVDVDITVFDKNEEKYMTKNIFARYNVSGLDMVENLFSESSLMYKMTFGVRDSVAPGDYNITIFAEDEVQVSSIISMKIIEHVKTNETDEDTYLPEEEDSGTREWIKDNIVYILIVAIIIILILIVLFALL